MIKAGRFYYKHNIMMNRFAMFLFVVLPFITESCSTDKSDSSSQPTASVSVYALVPDAPELNMFLNGNNIAASVPFGSFTLYNQVAAGTTVLKVQTANDNIRVDTSFTIAAGNYYSLFLTGALASIKPVMIHDSLGSVESGYFNLRFFVFSPATPALDFHVFKTDSTTVNNLTWKNRSFSNDITNDSINKFIRFATGTYNFYAVKTNTTDTIARFTNRTFSDFTNYTLMLEGPAAGDTTLQLGLRKHQ